MFDSNKLIHEQDALSEYCGGLG